MKSVFADAVYWIALLDRNEDLYQTAIEVSKHLGRVHIVTSEYVLIEVINGLSRDAYRKHIACKMIETLELDPFVIIVPSSNKMFKAALKRCIDTKDKNWSLVDCSSFEIMTEKRIQEALTYDHHFEQAGFVALLRGHFYKETFSSIGMRSKIS